MPLPAYPNPCPHAAVWPWVRRVCSGRDLDLDHRAHALHGPGPMSRLDVPLTYAVIGLILGAIIVYLTR